MHRAVPPSRRRRAPSTLRGMTLVEMMVALALGLLLLLVLVGVFFGSNQARRELARASEVHESGRYVLEVLRTELSQAGFYGTLEAPGGLTDQPCSHLLSEWRTSLALHVRGHNQSDAGTAFTCIDALRRPGTDAIFLQRASTCVVGAPGCSAPLAGQAYLQVSQCGPEYFVTPFVLDVHPAPGAASPFTLRTRSCQSSPSAPLRAHLRRIYYVSAAQELSYVDLTPAGRGAPVVVSPGVENLQLVYAIDADGNGMPDSHSSTPTATQWPDVIGVRIWVLARSGNEGLSPQGSSFVMGDVTVTPGAADRVQRRLFSTYVMFNTPQGRRE